MAVTVSIPTVLRQHTGGNKRIEASGSTVGAVIADLESQYSALKGRIVSDGHLHRFVNVYVNDDDVRTEDGLDTLVREGSTVTIMSAMAGGA